MDKLSFEEREIFALQTVVTHLIAVLSEEQRQTLQRLTTRSMDGMIEADTRHAHHYADIKKSVMEIINTGGMKNGK